MSESETKCACERCEAVLWRALRMCVFALRDRDNPDLSEDGARMTVITMLHEQVAARHPLGIAEQLYWAINALHVGDNGDAMNILESLEDDERAVVDAGDAVACARA